MRARAREKIGDDATCSGFKSHISLKTSWGLGLNIALKKVMNTMENIGEKNLTLTTHAFAMMGLKLIHVQ